MSESGPDFFHRGSSSEPGRDFSRAREDRVGGAALVSIAYWIVRGVQLLFGSLDRLVHKRSRN